MVARFQVLSALTAEARHALADDIARHGVLVPVEVDEEGNVLDGHHRVEIATEQGIDYPIVVRAGLTEDERYEHALRLNLLRRHLGPIEWANAARRLAELRGIRIGSQGRQQGKTDTLSDFFTGLGVDARTARRRFRLAERLADHPDIASRLDRGEIDASRAEELARTREYEARRAEVDPPARTSLGNGIDIRLGRFREALADLADESVDLILTDPLWQWDEESLRVWDDLGQLAARVLRPGRALVAYSGSGCQAEAMARLGAHLSYVWSGSLPLTGRHSEIAAVLARDASTPILFYAKDRYEPRHWFVNAVASPGPEKDAHPWQKPLANVAYYLRCFSEPGELVVDPFLGGGTTAVAAAKERRRFVGCDTDPVAVQTSIDRVRKLEEEDP